METTFTEVENQFSWKFILSLFRLQTNNFLNVNTSRFIVSLTVIF